MAKKKYEVVEEIVKEVIKKTDYEFLVKTSDDNIKLRKTHSFNDVSSNIVGKMTPNKTYKVIEVITYTTVPMYKLDNGYYVIAHQSVKKID